MIPQLFRNQKPEYPQLSRMQTTTKISATGGSIGFGIGGLSRNKRCLSIHSIRAERLRKDYWLYVVFTCLPTGQAGASTPEIHIIRDPVRLEWEPLVKIEHYHVGANTILRAEIAQ